MADMNVRVDFQTNAAAVRKQINDLSHDVESLASKNKLARALEGNKASARNLTGQINGRKAIIKLEKQIDSLARRRMALVTANKNFGDQDRYVKSLVKQNEVLRIQRKILDDNATAMINLGKNTQWAGRQLVVGFTVPLTIAAGAAMKAFSDLEKEMVRFKRVYGDAFTSTDEVTAMANEVKKLAVEWTKYGVAVSETAKIAADAAGAGFGDKQLLNQINAANKLAVLGEVDKQKALKSTIALQSTFKMSNEELAQSINYLNQLENQTMVTLDDMTTAIPKAATVVEGLGGSIKDLGTFLAAMEEGGVTAAEAANALKSGLGSLLNPSKKAQEELEKVGIIMSDLWARSEQNGQGVMYVVEELSKAFDRLGQTQRQALTEEIFGKHQFARMNALLQNINTGTQATQAKTVAAAGQLESALIAQQELGKLGASTLTQFQASIERVKAAIAPLGETIMKFVTPLIEFSAKVIEKFNNMPDAFKSIALGIVAAGGIIAPVFLMLLGQIQNLIGNGMKFANSIRNWGKNTQWVSEENLVLADTLSKVDAQLIAENRLLQQNTSLWQQRSAAAGGAPVAGKRKKFARGGQVGGSGSGDTVPALLTPGEFVVNKAASEKFGSILHAINSGALKGFNKGYVNTEDYVMAHLTAPKSGIPDASAFGPAHGRQLESFARTVSGKLGMDPATFMTYVSNLTRPLPGTVNAALNGSGLPARELAKHFNSRRITARNQPMAQALWSAGVDRKRISGGEFVSAQKEFDSILRGMLSRRGNRLVADAELYMMVDKALTKMAMSGKHPEFVGQMGRAGAMVGQARPVRVTELAALADHYNSKNPNSKITAWDLLSREAGSKTGFRPDSLRANNRSYRTFGKALWQQMIGFGGVHKFADGGYVPGTGNKDTVPAMLTPGESVINKKASQKFGPLLEAMNSGKLKLLAGGEVPRDKGYRGGLGSEDRRSLLDPLRNNLEGFLSELTQVLGLSERQVEKTRRELQKDVAGQTRASHIVPMFDEVGNKIYDDENLVAATARENQAMLDLGKKQAQSIMRQIAANGKDADAVTKRTIILDKLAAQEHIVLEEERALLKEMMIEAQQLKKSNPDAYNALPPTLRGAQGRAFTTTLSDQSRLFATQQPITKPQYQTAVAMGTGSKMKNVADDLDDLGDSTKGASGAMGGFGVLMAGQALMMTGLTDKMGKFGESLMAAITVLSTMQMMGINPLGGMGGKLKGAAAGKIAAGGKMGKVLGSLKAGIGPGLAIGLGGTLLGGLISNGQGGARDVAGKATSWAAMGGAIGMMLPGGPLTAGIGAAIGALAGFVVQVRANKKALEELTIASQESTGAVNAMADELQAKFQIGTNKTFAEMLSAGGSFTGDNKELYKVLSEAMSDPSSPFNKRIAQLTEAQAKGVLSPGQIVTDLQAMTMELRGRGVDEESIKIVTAAFVDKLPDAVKQGFDASELAKQATMSTDQIIASIGSGTAGQAGSLVTTTLTALNQSLLNLDMTSKDYDKRLEEITTQIEKTNDAHIRYEQSLGNNNDELLRYNSALASGAEALIRQGRGGGIREGQVEQLLNSNVLGDNGKLASAVTVLMEAGVDLQWAADAIAQGGADLTATAAQILGASNNIQAQALYANAERQATENANKLEQSIKDFDNATSKRAAAIAKGEKNYSAGGSTFNKLGLDDQRVKNLKISASAEVERINIQMGAVKAFAAKFNGMFNANIDSFADAGFIIDRIGRQIDSIQRNKIQPLQDKIQGLNRANELDSRKIDKLQKKQAAWEEAHQKRIEKINKQYEDQAKALEAVRRQQEYIAQQQQANISLADALSKGDLAGAAGAMVQAAQNQAQYAGTFAEQQLADRRDAALAAEEKKKNPYDSKIEAIQARIEKRTASIQALEDKIYNIEKNQIRPLERKQALMQSILATAQAEAEEQAHNAAGIDAENQAREEALNAAKLAVIEAQNERSEREKINDTYDDELKKIAETHGLKMTNAEELRKTLKANAEEARADATRFANLLADAQADYLEIKKGSTTIIDEWTTAKAEPDTIMETIRLALDEIQGTAKTDSETDRENRRVRRAGGGVIEGRGGQDSVPALLTPGEFVMRKSAVERIGSENLRRMNQGPVKYAKGGYVGTNQPNFLGTFGEVFGDYAMGTGKFKSAAPSSSSGYPAAGGSFTPIPGGGNLVTVNRAGDKLSTASYAAFKKAERMFGRSIPITQGGYSYRIKASGTTHHKDGVVDLPWLGRNQLIALRKAGWAAWFRNQFGANNLHVHAVQIGNRSADANAQGQVRSYMAGGNGLGGRDNGPRMPGMPGIKAGTYNRLYAGGLVGFNKGGLVPGSGNVDSVPSILTPGEFVMNRSAVSTIGTAPLRALNEGRLRTKAPMPTTQHVSNPIEAPVYNNYEMSFTIHDAADPYETANVIVRQFERASRSKKRNR